MTITKDTTVTVTEGNFRILMGKGLTTFYVDEQSKFVLRTAGEIDKLLEMLIAAKVKLSEA